MLPIVLGAVWLLGAVGFYLAEAYIENNVGWGYEVPPLGLCTILWFIAAPICLLVIARKDIKELGYQHRLQKEKSKKLRIAEEQQLQKIIQDLEQDETFNSRQYEVK